MSTAVKEASSRTEEVRHSLAEQQFPVGAQPPRRHEDLHPAEWPCKASDKRRGRVWPWSQVEDLVAVEQPLQFTMFFG